jgi:hypothetical protein
MVQVGSEIPIAAEDVEKAKLLDHFIPDFSPHQSIINHT